MKYTLLDVTQTVLSSINGDEVNSISDTVESQQVALYARTAFYAIVGRADLPEHHDLFQLSASGDILLPTVMFLPSDVTNLDWVKYDKQTVADPIVRMENVMWCPLDHFLEITHQYRTDMSDVGTATVTLGTREITHYYKTDIAPSYYTTPDDYTVLFDSYNVAVDTTLQASKTLCYGELSVSFSLADAFIPDLDENQFNLWLQETKALAWAEMKQTVNPKAELEARRGWRTLQRKKHGVHTNTRVDTPDYGRK